MTTPYRDHTTALAVIHNELARSKNDMGIIALRLVMMLACRAATDKELMIHRLRVSDYVDSLGLVGKSAYEQLQQVCRRLLQTLVEIRNPVENSRTVFQVMSLAKYWDKDGEIELKFHEEMRPLLLDLRNHFTKLNLLTFMRIQGVYAAKFYLVCASWNPRENSNYSPGWEMSIEQLRNWLSIEPDEYKLTGHLQAAVIDRARRELNRIADMSFDYEPIKRGKKITGWQFIPRSNKPVEKNPISLRKDARSKALKAKQEVEIAEELKKAELVLDEEYNRLISMWFEAGFEQRKQWIDALPNIWRSKIPGPTQKPSKLFLVALREVIEPLLIPL
jgi:plasmid replication initiation protein